MPFNGETSNVTLMEIPFKMKYGAAATKLHVQSYPSNTEPIIGIHYGMLGARFILQTGTITFNSTNVSKDSDKIVVRVAKDHKSNSRIKAEDTSDKVVVSGEEEVIKTMP